MSQDFFSRLGKYYLLVAGVLRGEADVARVFPNPADRGSTRETIYATFLRQHVPSKCNVSFGGYLFQEDGSESGQLDVIVTSDTSPRFDYLNPTGLGKTFSPVEGTLAVAAIKSTFEKEDIYETLNNIASIPPTKPLGRRSPPNLKIGDYSDWPYKIVFAYNGTIRAETIYRHILEFYEQRPDIPLVRRPNIIHVAGTCMINRMTEGYQSINKFTKVEKKTRVGNFELFTTDPDVQAIMMVVQNIQTNAVKSTYILSDHSYILNRVNLTEAD